MKNIHILPTDKSSRLSDCHDNKLYLDDVRYLRSYQNIYITSDEEIKDGDYVYSTAQDYNMQKVSKGLEKSYNNVEHYKKIILTTDQDLIKDGVQAIDDEFLEWFVKNPSCEEVNIEKVGGKYFSDRTIGIISYEIIIPKEIDVLELGQIIPKEEPKQETLEYGLLKHIEFCLECGNESQAIRLIEKYGFQKQQERYSEEDLDAFRKFMIQEQNFSKSCLDVFVKQFKNK